MSDAIVIQQEMKGIQKVDLIENVGYARLCINDLADELKSKGYTIDRTLVSSIGLILPRGEPYRLIRAEGERDLDPEKLSVQSPPFYVSDVLSRDSTDLQTLERLYYRLLTTERHSGEPPIRIPEAREVGMKIGGGLVFIVFVRGFEVPVNLQKRERQGEMIAMQQASEVTVSLFVLDASTGDVVWDDRVVKNGGTIYREKILQLLGKLVDNLP